MLTGLRLLLPALVPSWRFFDGVTASPRLDYALLPAADAQVDHWHEFRPRPAALSPAAMLRRLFWNPEWNETLFLVSLAERLLNPATPESAAHSQREMLLRVARDLVAGEGDWLQIRLRLVSRSGPANAIDSEIAYRSAPCRVAALMTP